MGETRNRRDRHDDRPRQDGDDRRPPPPREEPDAETNVVIGASRPVDGVGSVEDNPDWGAAGQTLLRLTDAWYEDGLGEMAVADRPNPRDISNAVSQQDGLVPNATGASDFLWAWGQFIDHDLDLTEAGATEYVPIVVPDGDPVFADGAIIPFTRVDAEDGTGVSDVREYANEITAFLDASMVYGSDEETAASLRGEGGKLLLDADGLLIQTESGVLAGDVRAAENVALTTLHTLFAREHNRWVDVLTEQDPSLTDDELFDAARNRVEAEIQAITYNEFLPILLGDDAIAEYSGYDPSVNPGISVEFSTAVYRFGHSLLSPTIQRLDEDGETISAGQLALRDAFFSPGEIYDNGGIDPILRGLGDGTAQELDTMVVEDVRSFLFAEDGETGMDLAAINIQRGRDLGVGSYNDLREAVGLDRVTSFSEITSDAELAAELEALYGDVDLVDAWIGGLAEDAMDGGMLGETFSLVMIDQFTRLRDGDPYWSEGSDLPPEEIEALWSTTLSDVIEWNTDVGTIQDQVFFAYDRQGGGDGRDDLTGTDARDLLLGEGGDDRLSGGANDDQLDGGAGRDRIEGGAGDDILTGGADEDRFVFRRADAGHDTVTDFERGDRIDLTDFRDIRRFEDLRFVETDEGVLLDLGPDQSILFENADFAEIRPEDFLL